MGRYHLCTALAVAMTVVAAGAGTQIPTATATSATSDLALKAKLSLTSAIGGCSLPAPGDECAARTGSGVVPGLGAVTESYVFPVGLGPPECAQSDGTALASSNRFVVAGKGEIHFTLAQGACMVQAGIYNEPQAYSVTGGTGIYAGASGSGTVERNLGEEGFGGRKGPEWWTGTLSVPGLDFDTTQPTFTGAANKTVRAAKGAKTGRVRFAVTAHDDRDVVVPATSCTPTSGSRFRIGRTKVTCEATDSSGNTGRTTFVVTVKRRR